MNNVRGVNVEATSKKLIHEVLTMIVGQVLPRVNDSVHIRLHEISDDVDIFVANLRWWFLHVHQTDDIFVIKEFYS